jgi:hypothetical protein
VQVHLAHEAVKVHGNDWTKHFRKTPTVKGPFNVSELLVRLPQEERYRMIC